MKRNILTLCSIFCVLLATAQEVTVTNNLNAFIKTNPAMLAGLDDFPWEGCRDFVLEIGLPEGDKLITQRVCGVKGYCTPINPILEADPYKAHRTIELKESTMIRSGDFTIALAPGTYRIDRDGMIRELRYSIEPR